MPVSLATGEGYVRVTGPHRFLGCGGASGEVTTMRGTTDMIAQIGIEGYAHARAVSSRRYPIAGDDATGSAWEGDAHRA
jgi:hypothetical protein